MRCVFRRVRLAALVFFACLVLAGPVQAVDLYQVSTIEALSAGLYEGKMTFADLARHGDFGLGTFVDLDGEMVALDGGFYQIKSDGSVHTARPEAKTPFADVVFFKGTRDLGAVDGLDLDGLKAALMAKLADPARYYVVRVDGTFSRLTARSVPAQPKPWPTLADAIKGQRLFPLEQVSGTMIGVYAPPSAPGLSPTGWHFHFLSKDRTQGGHVLAVSIAQAKARADNVERVTVEFPDHPLPRQGVAGPAAGTE